LKNGKQRKMKPNYKAKKTKGMTERKIYFEESESDLPAFIYESVFYDDDVSDDGEYVSYRDVFLI